MQSVFRIYCFFAKVFCKPPSSDCYIAGIAGLPSLAGPDDDGPDHLDNWNVVFLRRFVLV